MLVNSALGEWSQIVRIESVIEVEVVVVIVVVGGVVDVGVVGGAGIAGGAGVVSLSSRCVNPTLRPTISHRAITTV